MSAQEQFLESHVVHFGIGTPSRILKLLQNGKQTFFWDNAHLWFDNLLNIIFKSSPLLTFRFIKDVTIKICDSWLDLERSKTAENGRHSRGVYMMHCISHCLLTVFHTPILKALMRGDSWEKKTYFQSFHRCFKLKKELSSCKCSNQAEQTCRFFNQSGARPNPPVDFLTRVFPRLAQVACLSV